MIKFKHLIARLFILPLALFTAQLTQPLIYAQPLGQTNYPVSGASYPGVTTDGANGLLVTGNVQAATFSTASGVALLQGLVGCPGSIPALNYAFCFDTGGVPTLMASPSTKTVLQTAITLTTTGSSGAATFSGGTLNIPQYSGGGGSRTLSFPFGILNTLTTVVTTVNTNGAGGTGALGDFGSGVSFATAAATNYVTFNVDLRSWDGNAIALDLYGASGGGGGGTVLYDISTSCPALSTTGISSTLTFNTAQLSNSYVAPGNANLFRMNIASITTTGCTAGAGHVMVVKIKRDSTGTDAGSSVLTMASVTGVL